MARRFCDAFRDLRRLPFPKIPAIVFPTVKPGWGAERYNWALCVWDYRELVGESYVEELNAPTIGSITSPDRCLLINRKNG